MLKKREKKSFGAYLDYFLEECLVVSNPFEITHIHITESNEFISDIYDYEPKTGILVKDDEHIGILPWQKAARWATGSDQFNKCVFLKHRTTWNDMVEKGLIKADKEEALEWKQDDADAPQPTPTKKENKGFLKSLLGK